MLEDLLRKRDWLLADGATGTNLFDMGLVSGEAPEAWLDLHPDRIVTLHRKFIDAGADIILTNTFGCNRRRLALHNLQDQVRRLNATAVRLAREAAGSAGRPIVIAGSVGPTGDLLAPLGPLTVEECEDVFVEQIEGLRDGGAHVAWIETMSALEEMQAAARAAHRCKMPFVVTASFDTAGRTMMGLAPGPLAQTLDDLQPPPVAIGANCGVGASDLLASILAITAAIPGAVVVAKANCGVPKVNGDQVIYSGTPALMQDYARLARDAGARIIGGCCGTSPDHLAAMRHALEEHAPSMRPDLASVVSALGPLVSPPSDNAGQKRRSRRSGGGSGTAE
jgi:5-methyltetrahydrofolate--homocysteine methyltransferase